MFNQILSVVCVILKVAAFIAGEFGVLAMMAYSSDQGNETGAK